VESTEIGVPWTTANAENNTVTAMDWDSNMARSCTSSNRGGSLDLTQMIVDLLFRTMASTVRSDDLMRLRTRGSLCRHPAGNATYLPTFDNMPTPPDNQYVSQAVAKTHCIAKWHRSDVQFTTQAF
jgi:hypothetical protein